MSPKKTDLWSHSQEGGSEQWFHCSPSSAGLSFQRTTRPWSLSFPHRCLHFAQVHWLVSHVCLSSSFLADSWRCGHLQNRTLRQAAPCVFWAWRVAECGSLQGQSSRCYCQSNVGFLTCFRCRRRWSVVHCRIKPASVSVNPTENTCTCAW